jgi:hypothetical protein
MRSSRVEPKREDSASDEGVGAFISQIGSLLQLRRSSFLSLEAAKRADTAFCGGLRGEFQEG